jgi:hypothetical protein
MTDRSTESAALTEIDAEVAKVRSLIGAAAPWRDSDPGLSISGFICDGATATGDAYSQSPAASAEAAALDEISVVLDRACAGAKNAIRFDFGF